MEVWRHAQDVIRQFKQCENAVLFASGSCWEGVDFPGDMVSSLILPRLPFSAPDPLSEAEREQYPTLEHYISEAVVPEMQRKLRQGFGRAIRTETDVCAVSILDRRACPGGRYHQAVLNALPECPVTRSVGEIEAFLRLKMLMCDKVAHKNLIDDSPLFRKTQDIITCPALCFCFQID